MSNQAKSSRWKVHGEIIRIVGFRSWLWIALRLDVAWEWCERVIYCHHNARVLSHMEYRLSCVLSEATGGRMSKAYYDVETMLYEIRLKHAEIYDEGYNDASTTPQRISKRAEITSLPPIFAKCKSA